VVSPALDPNSTTVEVWIQAPNPKERLKPGTSVQTSVTTQTVASALTIPATALLTEPDGSTSVMVVGSDGRAHPHDVKPGIRDGDDLQIVEGLKLGDRVVTTGAYGLPDNTLVRLAAQSEEKPNTAMKGQKDEKDGKTEKDVQEKKDQN
jgi:multidrug efflux pump subunit AcrA (membrane-fusion protein)